MSGGMIASGRIADTWTCRTCGAVYHRMRDVQAHSQAGDGHVLFTASNRQPFNQSQATGSYTIPVPKDPLTGKFRVGEQEQ